MDQLVGLLQLYQGCTFPISCTLTRYAYLTYNSGGMIAPILGGILLMINRAVPVYTAVVIFAIAGFCVLLLKEDNSSRRAKGKAVLH